MTKISLLLLLWYFQPKNSCGLSLRVLYAGPEAKYAEYAKHLPIAFEQANLEVSFTNDLAENAESIDYIIYSPKGPLKDFSLYANVKAVFNLRAGAEGTQAVPSNIPVTRMVDPGLREGMVEYVMGHVLRYHLSTDDLWKQKQKGEWKPRMPPLASQRTVGILGLGELGTSCAKALLDLRFQVHGWSRTPKELEGVKCSHGPTGIGNVLKEADILVLLLPDTPQTKHILCRETFARCKPGVQIINVGRGSAIQEDDLLLALNQGIVAGATLDVFEKEPLPADHGFWEHPNVLVTPHVAAKTRAITASAVIVENIQRAERGEALLYEIDREAGY